MEADQDVFGLDDDETAMRAALEARKKTAAAKAAIARVEAAAAKAEAGKTAAASKAAKARERRRIGKKTPAAETGYAARCAPIPSDKPAKDKDKTRERQPSAQSALLPREKPAAAPAPPTNGVKCIYRGSNIYLGKECFRVIVNPWETRTDTSFHWEGHMKACFKRVLAAVDAARD
jgi:hypothetical protein